MTEKSMRNIDTYAAYIMCYAFIEYRIYTRCFTTIQKFSWDFRFDGLTNAFLILFIFFSQRKRIYKYKSGFIQSTREQSIYMF